jgi:HEAT repeat protein
LLLTAAAGGAEAEAAKQSLAELRGTGIDKALSAIVTNSGSKPSAAAAAISVLAARKAESSVPVLFKAATDKSPEVSAAAFAALRDIAPYSSLNETLGLLISTSSDRRDGAVEAASEIAKRGGGENPAAPIVAALKNVRKPADRIALYGVLNAVGGRKAEAAITDGLKDVDPDVRIAAVGILAEWPSDDPLDALTNLARTSKDARERTLALRGCLRMIAAG